MWKITEREEEEFQEIHQGETQDELTRNFMDAEICGSSLFSVVLPSVETTIDD